jgi:hypothetical protein
MRVTLGFRAFWRQQLKRNAASKAFVLRTGGIIQRAIVVQIQIIVVLAGQ